MTQNSAIAFKGYFAAKPAVLFADIDFHQIAASVPRSGLEAIREQDESSDFGRYLFWFLQGQSIAR